jgi:anti-sigma regulatory factor (Ser/Thr protein kinase)
MDTQVREAATTLPPAPTAPRDARRFVTATLTAWSAEDAIDVVQLLTCELVTNAVLHVRTAIDLRLVRSDGSLRVEVADRSPALPRSPRYDDDEATTGRGLNLVEALATRWGIEPGDGAKTLWFEVAAEAA